MAVQYGMGEESLATKLNRPVSEARELLRLHRRTYPRFWRWSNGTVDYAMLNCKLWTVFGWPILVGRDANPRSLANFPMQANGAEMLRLACSLATERGILVCAPVHDAVLVEGPLSDIATTVVATQDAMRQASELVLGGFELRSDVKLVSYPDHYMDERGLRMWNEVWALLRKGDEPARQRDATCASVQTPSSLISSSLL